MTNPLCEEPMWPSTNIPVSHTLNKHSVPSDNTYEGIIAWFCAMGNYPAPKPLPFHPNLSCLSDIPTPEHWNHSWGVSTHLTCAYNTLASTSLPKWFQICPRFPYFVIISQILASEVLLCTSENTHKMSEALSKLSKHRDSQQKDRTAQARMALGRVHSTIKKFKQVSCSFWVITVTVLHNYRKQKAPKTLQQTFTFQLLCNVIK